MSTYCITCKWSGISTRSGHYIVDDEAKLEAILAWLEMGRSSADPIPYDIQVFKLMEEEEVIKIRDSLREEK